MFSDYSPHIADQIAPIGLVVTDGRIGTVSNPRYRLFAPKNQIFGGFFSFQVNL